MTDHEKITFKNMLKRWGLDLIQQRIATSQEAMQQAQEAANSEEKSSAGDKYETGRAMGHLQKDMHARQLAESVKELAILHAVQTGFLLNEGRTGAVLQTEGITFFISTGLGRQSINSQAVFFLSPQAPLAKLLLNKRPGDTILVNQKLSTILDVF